MFRDLVLAAAAATMVGAPVAAQAAPARAATPVASESEGLAGAGWVVPLVGFLAISAALLLILDDGDDDVPTSP